MKTKSNSRQAPNRNGIVLIVVLIALVVLSLSAYAFAILMRTEDEASRLMTRRIQSKYIVDSGVDYSRLILSYDDTVIRAKGGIWSNGDLFQDVIVALDASNPEIVGRFSVVAPAMDDEGNSVSNRFGLLDESNKINVNTLPYADNWIEGGGRSLLMSLPGMDEEIADAILDWIDEDDDVREFGLESSAYLSNDPPYMARNGPIESIEELLLVNGVTPVLLFGNDTNRNGVIDDNENVDGVSSLDFDMLLGWANYLTLFSKETNKNDQGLTRININSPELEQLYDDLRSAFDEEWSRFIINYRINGPYTPTADDEVSGNTANFEIDFEQEGSYTFTQLLDLVDVYTTAFDPDDLNDKAIIQSPLQSANKYFLLPIVMQNLTTFQGDTIPGRINIMQAPARVLEGIPGMTPELIETIIQKREFELDDPDGSDQNRKYETWIYAEDLVDLTTMQIMLPFICVGGDVYSAEIVGYFTDGVGTSRSKAVFDTTVPIPRLLFWRDKSHLQGAYSIDSLRTDLIQSTDQ